MNSYFYLNIFHMLAIILSFWTQKHILYICIDRIRRLIKKYLYIETTMKWITG